MKRRNRWRILLAIIVLGVAVEQVLAASVGPFSFSFASGLLNSLFLLPLSLGGC